MAITLKKEILDRLKKADYAYIVVADKNGAGSTEIIDEKNPVLYAPIAGLLSADLTVMGLKMSGMIQPQPVQEKK